MSEELVIREAAIKALNIIGRPASISEIYTTINERGLYKFNTPTPEHVLRTTIRRHTKNIERVDSASLIFFEMLDDEIYGNVKMTDQPQKKSAATGIKRIHRASDKDDIIKSMTSEQLGVFREIWKLLLFAAQVGVANNTREPLSAIDSGKGIDQSTFGNSASWPGVVYLMSLVETNDSDSLSGMTEAEESRISVFQEYANGGLGVLKEFFKERPIDLDGLLAFIESQTAKTSSGPDVNLTI